METNPPENDPWVDHRLASLVPKRDWIPNAGRTLARLQARHRAAARERAMAAQRWIWTTLVAASAVAALLLVPASRACAQQPGACVLRVLGVRGKSVNAPTSPAVATPSAITQPSLPIVGHAAPLPAANPAGPLLQSNFKETGSASAPLCVEVYIDYECPHCETFVRDIAPRLTEQYVQTGKARLVYRDYPLPSHSHARLAARYADAAGKFGYYDAVMKQLFATRAAWSVSGDIDSQVAHVLPADVADQVRAHVQNDPQLDDALLSDRAAGQADHLDRVPFVVIVSGGKRQPVTDAPLTFDVLKVGLDRLLGQ